jgi:hypothetical protein
VERTRTSTQAPPFEPLRVDFRQSEFFITAYLSSVATMRTSTQAPPFWPLRVDFRQSEFFTSIVPVPSF